MQRSNPSSFCLLFTPADVPESLIADHLLAPVGKIGIYGGERRIEISEWKEYSLTDKAGS
jgi:hypothetical protein